DLSDYVENDEQMEKQLRSLSGGLAEVKNEGVAQLIHQSVNDYLVNEGFQTLDSSLESADIAVGQGHIRLSRSCIQCIKMDEIGQCQLREEVLLWEIDRLERKA